MIETVPTRSVTRAKITEYLLNPAHEIGGPKSAFFLACGFSIDQYQIMIDALNSHPDRNPIDKTEGSRWGKKYIVRYFIETPDGRNPCILSVWIVRNGWQNAELVTAYPAD